MSGKLQITWLLALMLTLEKIVVCKELQVAIVLAYFFPRETKENGGG